MPKISVIVPVYKVEPYLCRCLDSILEQTFTDFELILIDDGSPDRCGVICDEYAQKDSRVHVIHQKNGGRSVAKNSGIDWVFTNSNSEWLAFIDSDDWVHPRYLEVLLNIAIKYDVRVSICGYQENDGIALIDEEEQLTVLNYYPEEFFVRYRVNAIVPWAKLYKRDCFTKIRYPEGRIHEDEFVTYQILFELSEIAVTNMKLYYYFQNQDGIMKSQWTPKRLDAFDAFEEQIEYFNLKGLKKAKKCCVRAYVGYICDQLSLMKELSTMNMYSNIKKKLLIKLRRALRIYKELVPFYECKWAYAVAYPKLIKCYNVIEGVVKLISGRK